MRLGGAETHFCADRRKKAPSEWALLLGTAAPFSAALTESGFIPILWLSDPQIIEERENLEVVNTFIFAQQHRRAVEAWMSN